MNNERNSASRTGRNRPLQEQKSLRRLHSSSLGRQAAQQLSHLLMPRSRGGFRAHKNSTIVALLWRACMQCMCSLTNPTKRQQVRAAHTSAEVELLSLNTRPKASHYYFYYYYFIFIIKDNKTVRQHIAYRSQRSIGTRRLNILKPRQGNTRDNTVTTYARSRVSELKPRGPCLQSYLSS